MLQFKLNCTCMCVCACVRALRLSNGWFLYFGCADAANLWVCVVHQSLSKRLAAIIESLSTKATATNVSCIACARGGENVIFIDFIGQIDSPKKMALMCIRITHFWHWFTRNWFLKADWQLSHRFKNRITMRIFFCTNSKGEQTVAVSAITHTVSIFRFDMRFMN